MIQLTSYERMRRYICSTAGNALTDTKAQKQMIVNWIMASSKQIETFLGRWLKIDSYTEYFDTVSERDSYFFAHGYPITSLTDVYLDSSGNFSGAEGEIDSCIVGKNGDSIILPIQPGTRGFKTIRARYLGGLAYNGVRSTFTIGSVVGTWIVGSFASGGTSEAVGIVKSVSTTSMVVEVLYGIFEAGESLTEYTDEDLTISDATATLVTVDQRSLVETYPDIVRAAEIQVRHYWKHKDDFELSSTSKDSTNQRQSSAQDRSPLTPEAMSILTPYRRLTI